MKTGIKPIMLLALPLLVLSQQAQAASPEEERLFESIGQSAQTCRNKLKTEIDRAKQDNRFLDTMRFSFTLGQMDASCPRHIHNMNRAKGCLDALHPSELPGNYCGTDISGWNELRDEFIRVRDDVSDSPTQTRPSTPEIPIKKYSL